MDADALLLLSAVTLAATTGSLPIILFDRLNYKILPSRLLALAAIFLVASYSVWPRQSARDERLSKYTNDAKVRRENGWVTSYANNPRPLAQALRALCYEHGWIVDYEDPPYFSTADLVDDTAPEWRAKHPNEKGVTGINGGAFETRFPASGAEEIILDSVIADYNKSGNPGHFDVVKEGEGRFAVVGRFVKDNDGREQAVDSILDAPVSIERQTRNTYETVAKILDAVSAQTHVKVGPGTVPTNATIQSRVTLGGPNVTARVLLMQLLSSSGIKVCWHLYYGGDGKTFALNLLSPDAMRWGP